MPENIHQSAKPDNQPIVVEETAVDHNMNDPAALTMEDVQHQLQNKVCDQEYTIEELKKQGKKACRKLKRVIKRKEAIIEQQREDMEGLRRSLDKPA